MSRASRLLALAAGLALFAYFINHVGLEELAAYARQTGWMLLPIFFLWIPIYACSAAAWRLILAHEPDCPGFGRLFAAIVSGSAINYITPFFAVGGEPFKATVAAEWLQSRRRAAASVVIQRLLFTLAHLLSMILALMLGVLLFPTTLAPCSCWSASASRWGSWPSWSSWCTGVVSWSGASIWPIACPDSAASRGRSSPGAKR